MPRGLLLVDGNMSQENIEQMEDYICDVMSGSPVNQWRIPIIPSGEKENGIKWQSLGSTNKEMEYQGWIDFLTSAIVSLFGCSMEELGLHSSKSQPMFERNDAPKIESSKSSILGTTLTFLQSYINRILEKFFPEYEFEFVGYERDDPKQVLDLDIICGIASECTSIELVIIVSLSKDIPSPHSRRNLSPFIKNVVLQYTGGVIVILSENDEIILTVVFGAE